ncbi:hypothetical protein EFM06_09375, partial [Lactobacillus helveticus]|nr:hypothetical protein [Lactobacillus helveticus]
NKNREKKRPIKLKLRVELIVFQYLRVGYFPDTFCSLIPNLVSKISMPSRCQVLPFPANSFSNNALWIFLISSPLILSSPDLKLKCNAKC